MPKYRCPKCGHDAFMTRASVPMAWFYDSDGELTSAIRCGGELHVAARLEEDSEIECCSCGYTAYTQDFKTKSNPETGEMI